MIASVIIRSRNEAPRLRLLLTSLERQSVPIVTLPRAAHGGRAAAEVIVVNDCSTDGTAAMLARAPWGMPITAINLESNIGRSAASNRGAAAATGDILIFLDGDVLVEPAFLASHLHAHQAAAGIVGRGATWHLRSTRQFLDPAVGTPMAGCEADVAKLGAQLAPMLVTDAQVRSDFEALRKRALPGIYSGAMPRLCYDLEWRALQETPDLALLWMAASGQNLSLPTAAFRASGGFDSRIDLNEHRELAYRLMAAGLKLRPVADAMSLHMIHRTGWRDPGAESAWKQRFYARHPALEVGVLDLYWLAVAGAAPWPSDVKVGSLADWDKLLRSGFDFAGVQAQLVGMQKG